MVEAVGGGRPGLGTWARSRVPQRLGRVLGKGTSVLVRRGRMRRLRPPPQPPHPTPTADPAPSAKPQPRSPEGVRVSGLLPTAQPGRRSGICGPRAPPRGHQASCTRAARLLSEAVCAFLFGSSKLEYRTNSGFPDPVCDASGGYRSKRDVSRNLAKT